MILNNGYFHTWWRLNDKFPSKNLFCSWYPQQNSNYTNRFGIQSGEFGDQVGTFSCLSCSWSHHWTVIHFTCQCQGLQFILTAIPVHPNTECMTVLVMGFYMFCNKTLKKLNSIQTGDPGTKSYQISYLCGRILEPLNITTVSYTQ